MELSKSLEYAKKQQELVNLAYDLFPGQITEGTETYICKCCGKTHSKYTIAVEWK